jgi:hypothetical protein
MYEEPCVYEENRINLSENFQEHHKPSSAPINSKTLRDYRKVPSHGFSASLYSELASEM